MTTFVSALTYLHRTAVNSPPDRTPGHVSSSVGDREVQGLLWGVGAVSSMVGVATPTLRTWDRRYGLGPSRRTEGGHRRYSQSDIARVELMSHLIDHGVPAQQAATVALTSDDGALDPRSVVTTAAAHATGPLLRHPRASSRATASAVASIMSAAEVLDAEGLARQVSAVFDRRGVVAGWSDVTVPVLRCIGERWSTGELGVEVEHLVSERIATELRALVRRGIGHRPTSRPVLLAGAPEDQHALALLALEAVLADKRIQSVPLGACTTPAALAGAVLRCDPAAVFVWASLPRSAGDGWLDRWPSSSRPRLLVLGGPGWAEADDVPAPPGVRVTRVHDLSAAAATLAAAA